MHCSKFFEMFKNSFCITFYKRSCCQILSSGLSRWAWRSPLRPHRPAGSVLSPKLLTMLSPVPPGTSKCLGLPCCLSEERLVECGISVTLTSPILPDALTPPQRNQGPHVISLTVRRRTVEITCASECRGGRSYTRVAPMSLSCNIRHLFL